MKKILISILLLSNLFIFASPTFAATLHGIRQRDYHSCVYAGGGDIGDIVTLNCIPILVVNLIFWAFSFAGVVALFLIIIAGIKFITSGGDPKQIDSARQTLTWAIIGLVLILLSLAIVGFIAHLTGVGCLTQIGFLQCEM